jgi:hypothetical protein
MSRNVEIEWGQRSPNEAVKKYRNLFELMLERQPEAPQRWAVDAEPQFKEVSSAPATNRDQPPMVLPLSPAEMERRQLYEKELDSTQQDHVVRMRSAKSGLDKSKQVNNVKKVNGMIKAIFQTSDKQQ